MKTPRITQAHCKISRRVCILRRCDPVNDAAAALPCVDASRTDQFRLNALKPEIVNEGEGRFNSAEAVASRLQ